MIGGLLQHSGGRFTNPGLTAIEFPISVVVPRVDAGGQVPLRLRDLGGRSGSMSVARRTRAQCNDTAHGKSPVGLPMPAMLKNAKREAWNEPFNRSLQELAWETVTNYRYSLVTAAKEK